MGWEVGRVFVVLGGEEVSLGEGGVGRRVGVEGEVFLGGRDSICRVGRRRFLERMEGIERDGNMESGVAWMRRVCE